MNVVEFLLVHRHMVTMQLLLHIGIPLAFLCLLLY